MNTIIVGISTLVACVLVTALSPILQAKCLDWEARMKKRIDEKYGKKK